MKDLFSKGQVVGIQLQVYEFRVVLDRRGPAYTSDKCGHGLLLLRQ